MHHFEPEAQARVRAALGIGEERKPLVVAGLAGREGVEKELEGATDFAITTKGLR